jgi:hypothetical protein
LLIGSLVTRQWRDTSDLDVQVIVDPRKLFANSSSTKATDVGSAYKMLRGTTGSIPIEQNVLPGTLHPIEYFVRQTFDLRKADAVYDITNDVWLKKLDASAELAPEDIPQGHHKGCKSDSKTI